MIGLLKTSTRTDLPKMKCQKGELILQCFLITLSVFAFLLPSMVGSKARTVQPSCAMASSKDQSFAIPNE